MKGWLGKVALVGLGLVMGLLVLEGLFRLMPGLLPPNLQLALKVRDTVAQRSQMFYHDPELGQVLKPDVDTTVDLVGEARYHVQTSDLGLGGPGFRDAQVQPPVYGVAIGDSFTYGLGVDEPETWVAQLQAQLGKEVVNLGQPGVGPVREAHIYQRYGRPLQPQVVLWMFFPNDLEDAMPWCSTGLVGEQGHSPTCGIECSQSCGPGPAWRWWWNSVWGEGLSPGQRDMRSMRWMGIRWSFSPISSPAISISRTPTSRRDGGSAAMRWPRHRPRPIRMEADSS